MPLLVTVTAPVAGLIPLVSATSLAFLALLGGLMMFSTGLLGEILMRTYFESQDRRIYAIREIRTRKPRGVAGTR